MTLTATIIDTFNRALYLNGVLIGHAVQDVDGFYYFNPNNQGTWTEYALRMIADYLEQVNQDWNEQLSIQLLRGPEDLTELDLENFPY